ncbi:MAG: sensor histidine kinase KdpD [Gemmatimonadetes bacterium]|nr:sensor histidine kinase KdpD [Gemmatimonadota bacterium]
MNGDTRRPDPDALLARVTQESPVVPRGRLKLFVGAAPGVGKTFTMLESARLRQRDGVDVLVGVVETHGRAETAAMLEGLPQLPRRPYTHRGTTLEEFDLEAALARRPALILVDELAHTNAPGAAHEKRWQDVEALRTAGIDVYSTLNVQHLESLNDIVAGITGVSVRETVPDAVLDDADEVELVDVSPEVLEQRLRDGKVYASPQAARALDHFFRRGNLIALRELALRRTAERVDAQMHGWRASSGIADAWAVSEAVLVCVGPSASATRLVRTARRLAGQLKAPWTALYVERPGDATLPAADREAAQDALQLAQELGGQALTVAGHDVADEAIAVAGRLNATRLLVGRTHRVLPRLLPWLGTAARLARRAPQVDVVIVGTRDPGAPERAPFAPRAVTPVGGAGSLREYAAALAWVGAVIVVALPLRSRIADIDVVMAFLLAVVITATRYGRGPALAATTLAVVAFDLLFVPPYGTFAVSDVRYVLTFVVMFTVGMVMAGLTRRVREQAHAAREREARTATLYALSRELAAARTDADVARIALRHLHDVTASPVALLEPDAGGHMQLTAALPTASWPESELAVARWCLDRQQPAGRGTATLPAAGALYLPLASEGQPRAVFGLAAPATRLADLGTRQLLDAMLDQVSVALDRTVLADRARAAHLEAEAEKLRNALLSSLSHDLRTPLGSVEGAASTLLRDATLPEPQRRELAATIVEESQRMTRLVGNLLDMVRVETGALHVQQQWHVVEEVVGGAVLRVEPRLADRVVSVHVPTTLPLVAMDDVLVQQVLVNLLENAARHTPAGTPIDVRADVRGRELLVSVADRGPGVPPDAATRIFGKFQRLAEGAGGIGLGLSICDGIVRAHGGRIWVEAREGGGAVFRFTLPMHTPPPVIEREDDIA